MPDDKRVEIIGGEMFDMSAAPSTRHQHIVGELFFQFCVFFRGKSCKPFTGPTDVKLSDEDVVQPDLLVVCDKDQVTDSHVEGAPSLVVEVLSPTTYWHDRKIKMELYARAGVKEVWLVSAVPSGIEVFVLDGDSYRLQGSFTTGDVLVSPGFDGLEIDLEAVFDFPFGFEETVRVVKEPFAEYQVKDDA